MRIVVVFIRDRVIMTARWSRRRDRVV